MLGHYLFSDHGIVLIAPSLKRNFMLRLGTKPKQNSMS